MQALIVSAACPVAGAACCVVSNHRRALHSNQSAESRQCRRMCRAFLFRCGELGKIYRRHINIYARDVFPCTAHSWSERDADMAAEG